VNYQISGYEMKCTTSEIVVLCSEMSMFVSLVQGTFELWQMSLSAVYCEYGW
jgi:hypothetical protein